MTLKRGAAGHLPLAQKYIDVRDLGFRPNTGVFVDEIIQEIQRIHPWPLDPTPLVVYLPRGVWHGRLAVGRSDISFIGDGDDQTIIQGMVPSVGGSNATFLAADTTTIVQIDVPRDNTPGSLWSIFNKRLAGFGLLGGVDGATPSNRTTHQGGPTPYLVTRLFITGLDPTIPLGTSGSGPNETNVYNLSLWSNGVWSFLADGTLRLHVRKTIATTANVSVSAHNYRVGLMEGTGLTTGVDGKIASNITGVPSTGGGEAAWATGFARMNLDTARRNAQKVRLLDPGAAANFSAGDVVWLNGGSYRLDPYQGDAMIIEHVDTRLNALTFNRPLHMDYHPDGWWASAVGTNIANVTLPSDGSIINLQLNLGFSGTIGAFWNNYYFSVGNFLVQVAGTASGITVPVINPPFLRAQQAGGSLLNQKVSRPRGVCRGDIRAHLNNVLVLFGLNPNHHQLIKQSRMYRNISVKGIRFEYNGFGLLANSMVDMDVEDCTFLNNHLDRNIVLNHLESASIFGANAGGLTARRTKWMSPLLQFQQTDSGSGYFHYHECSFTNTFIGASEFNHNIRYDKCHIAYDGSVGRFSPLVARAAERDGTTDGTAVLGGNSVSDFEITRCEFRVANVTNVMTNLDIQWDGAVSGRFNSYNMDVSDCRIFVSNCANVFASRTGGMTTIKNNFIEVDSVLRVVSVIGGGRFDPATSDTSMTSYTALEFSNNNVVGDFGCIYYGPRVSTLKNNNYVFVPRSGANWRAQQIISGRAAPVILAPSGAAATDPMTFAGLTVMNETYRNIPFHDGAFGPAGIPGISSVIGGGRIGALTFINSPTITVASNGTHRPAGNERNFYIEDLADYSTRHSSIERAMMHVRGTTNPTLEAEMLVGVWLSHVRRHGGACTNADVDAAYEALFTLCGGRAAQGLPRAIDSVLRMNLQIGDAICSRVPLLGYWWDASNTATHLDTLLVNMTDADYTPSAGWVLDHGKHMLLMRDAPYISYGEAGDDIAGMPRFYNNRRHAGYHGVCTPNTGYGFIFCSRREGAQVDALPPPQFQQTLNRAPVSLMNHWAHMLGGGSGIAGNQASGVTPCGWSSRSDSVSRIHTTPPGVYGLGFLRPRTGETMWTGDNMWHYYFRNIDVQPTQSTVTYTDDNLRCAYTNIGRVVATNAESFAINETTVVRRTPGFAVTGNLWSQWWGATRGVQLGVYTGSGLAVNDTWRGGNDAGFAAPRQQDLGAMAAVGMGLGGYCLHQWPAISWVTNSMTTEKPEHTPARTINAAFVLANRILGRFHNCRVFP